MVDQEQRAFTISELAVDWQDNGAAAQMPARTLDPRYSGNWTTRGLPTRGLDYSRIPPTGVFVVLIAWLGYVDIIQLTKSLVLYMLKYTRKKHK